MTIELTIREFDGWATLAHGVQADATPPGGHASESHT